MERAKQWTTVALLAERDTLRAEVERLRKELDEATTSWGFQNIELVGVRDLCDKLASAAKDHSHHGRRNAECGLCAALSEYHDQRGTSG